MNRRKFYNLVESSDKTLIEIAKAVGVSPPTISRWKNGTHEPNDSKKKLICSFFDVPMTYLMDESNDEDSALTKIDSSSIIFEYGNAKLIIPAEIPLDEKEAIISRVIREISGDVSTAIHPPK